MLLKLWRRLWTVFDLMDFIIVSFSLLFVWNWCWIWGRLVPCRSQIAGSWDGAETSF